MKSGFLWRKQKFQLKRCSRNLGLNALKLEIFQYLLIVQSPMIDVLLKSIIDVVNLNLQSHFTKFSIHYLGLDANFHKYCTSGLRKFFRNLEIRNLSSLASYHVTNISLRFMVASPYCATS